MSLTPFVAPPVPIAVAVLYVAAASVDIIRSDQTASWISAGLLATPLCGLRVLVYNAPMHGNSKPRFFTIVEQ